MSSVFRFILKKESSDNWSIPTIGLPKSYMNTRYIAHGIQIERKKYPLLIFHSLNSHMKTIRNAKLMSEMSSVISN